MNSIFFKEYGKGFPVILLHGFCETHQIWDSFAQELSTNFRVIIPDLPGFGQSKLLLDPFTIDDVGAVMIDWLSNLKIKSAVIIGHSLGGYVALAMAIRNEALVAGLGLFHSTALADSDEKKGNRDKTIEFVKSNGVKPFVEVFVSGLFYQRDNDQIPFVKKIALSTAKETLIGYSLAMRNRPSCEEWLTTNSMNVLIVAGENDSLIPLSTLQHQSTIAPKSTLFVLKNTGHMGMFESKLYSLKCVRQFVLMCENQAER